MTRPEAIGGFDLHPGRTLVRKYIVGDLLGKGWEGEVYHVTEKATGVERAAKFFYPRRNPSNRVVNFYARKLEKLRSCPIVIQYHTQESFRYRGHEITFLVSDYVQGELLTEYINRQPGKRLAPFEAIHLLHALVCGVEQIHEMREYHGDLHSDNVIVNRRGIGFELKLIDMYPWGKATRAHLHDDVCFLIRMFYDALGGARHYSRQPPQVKEICCGLKRTLIQRKFRSATELRKRLENLDWD